jgi:hypothetical protein
MLRLLSVEIRKVIYCKRKKFRAEFLKTAILSAYFGQIDPVVLAAAIFTLLLKKETPGPIQ